ncbi:hypothetical protein GGTG_14223, partial [Gaeumannomyces tritici R3-111a-1]
ERQRMRGGCLLGGIENQQWLTQVKPFASRKKQVKHQCGTRVFAGSNGVGVRPGWVEGAAATRLLAPGDRQQGSETWTRQAAFASDSRSELGCPCSVWPISGGQGVRRCRGDVGVWSFDWKPLTNRAEEEKAAKKRWAARAVWEMQSRKQQSPSQAVGW